MIDSTLADALWAIDPAKLPYSEWVNVGMALKSVGANISLWCDWSASDPRYKPGEMQSKWDSFQSEGVGSGTIIHLAEKFGWSYGSSGHALDWNDTLTVKPDPTFFNEAEKITIKQPGSGWDPIEEIVRYLQILFRPEDRVGYTFDCYVAEDGKFKPYGGHFRRTRDELIKALQKYNDIPSALGSYNTDAGGWINFNPTDGEGRKKENITGYRYALVESDSTPIETQIHIMHELKLPVAVLVASGGKSAHAIVHIDALTLEEYKARVTELFQICEEAGISIDQNNKNPGRLSRMPGLIRGEKKQFIIPYEAETHSWQEWHDGQIIDQISLPPIQNAADFVGADTPALAPELIYGILREGHKMLITGPSKAGKSFALIELSIAIGTGGRWFGWKCSEGPVLYLNFELDERSCFNRFNAVAEALHIPAKEACRNVHVMNLRGYNMSLDKFVPYLIGLTRETHYKAVIFDPLYKVMMGDENSAGDMAHFCNYFDMVCREMGCAAIYCHHHSKGSQSGKNVMDRGSGSGVFARDPDAIIDLLRLRLPPGFQSFVSGGEYPTELTKAGISLAPDATAWKVSCVLREFATPPDVKLWFGYPLHIVDPVTLSSCTPFDERPTADDMTELHKNEAAGRSSAALKAYSELKDLYPGGVVPVMSIREKAGLDVSHETIIKYFLKAGNFGIVGDQDGRNGLSAVVEKILTDAE